MAKRDIVVIGGSAGSLEALLNLLRSLPVNLPAAIFVVIHLTPRGKSVLAEIIDRQTGGLPAKQASEGERISPGRIYVAPPDRHLLVANSHIHLARGPKEGLHRPSINVTFRSAAATYGPRVIGVLLSGMLDDGASGLWEIANRGGVAVVQEPSEAQFPSMPLNALQDADISYRLPARGIGTILPKLVTGEESAEEKECVPHEHQPEKYSGFSCPECHGPLFQKEGPGPLQFRCRIGHILSLKTLLDEHTSTQERKLYEAVLALEEGADLALFTATRTDETQGRQLKQEAEQLRRHAREIKKLLEEREMSAID